MTSKQFMTYGIGGMVGTMVIFGAPTYRLIPALVMLASLCMLKIGIWRYGGDLAEARGYSWWVGFWLAFTFALPGWLITILIPKVDVALAKHRILDTVLSYLCLIGATVMCLVFWVGLVLAVADGAAWMEDPEGMVSSVWVCAVSVPLVWCLARWVRARARG